MGVSVKDLIKFDLFWVARFLSKSRFLLKINYNGEYKTNFLQQQILFQSKQKLVKKHLT